MLCCIVKNQFCSIILLLSFFAVVWYSYTHCYLLCVVFFVYIFAICQQIMLLFLRGKLYICAWEMYKYIENMRIN